MLPDPEHVRQLESTVQQLSARFPNELLVASNQRDRRWFDLYRVDVVTGASTPVETNDRFTGYVTDSRFRVRLGVRFTDDGGREYLRRRPDGEWEPFARLDLVDAITTRALGLSEDGEQLYWLDSRGRDKAAVVVEDLATRATRVLV